jgi:hypothetical protein
LRSAGPTLLPQFTRLQYEEKIREAEAPAKAILESLQNSAGMEIIRKRRREQNINPDEPLTIDEGILIEGPSNIERIKKELINKGIFEAYNLNEEQLIKFAQQWGVNTSSQLQQIKDSVADIREKLRKDDELRKKMEEESRREQMKKENDFLKNLWHGSRETTIKKRICTSERLKRQRREETVARQKGTSRSRSQGESGGRA